MLKEFWLADISPAHTLGDAGLGGAELGDGGAGGPCSCTALPLHCLPQPGVSPDDVQVLQPPTHSVVGVDGELEELFINDWSVKTDLQYW